MFFSEKNIFGRFWANLWVVKCRFSKLLPTFTLKPSQPRLLNSQESKSGRQKIIKSWICLIFCVNYIILNVNRVILASIKCGLRVVVEETLVIEICVVQEGLKQIFGDSALDVPLSFPHG